MSARASSSRDQAGVVTVFFALLIGLIMIIGSLVITVGSWYTHARQLQTKVDAGALAGGGAWAFPCTPDADARIATTARTFFGEHVAADGSSVPGTYNQQIGGVEGNQLFVTLNQAGWWDDAFPGADFTQPAGSVCESLTLDVKATESNSPLLWGWLPFVPDIKRKARVELQEAHGLNHLLPIAVRVPRPLSSAAVFFDETNGNVLAVRYFQDAADLTGLPAGLEGYSTQLSGGPAAIAGLPSRTGVAIALSFLPACGTPGTSPPCFEDEGFASVDSLCNQGDATQIVTCYHGPGSWPGQDITTGLHFLRGYATGTVGNGPPRLRGAFLENAGCESNGYFNSIFVGACSARLTVNVDLGSVVENVGGGGDDDDDDGGGPEQTRKAENVELRYALVRADGTTFCDAYGSTCELRPVDDEATGEVMYATSGTTASPHVPLTAASGANAIAIQVRVKESSVSPNPGSCGVGLRDFHRNCRWFHVGSGIFGTGTAPSSSQILASPVQRAFMGDLDQSGPVKWLRIGKDHDCDGDAEDLDGPAGTHRDDSAACFYVDMGLKGGMARDQDEPPFAFTEGSGPSQMGSVECDPAISQGQILTDGVVNGCSPFFTRNAFDSFPTCPSQSQFFALPKAAPFDDWPPLDCVKTRPTGAMNQLLDGLNLRIFGVRSNPSCPPDNGDGYVRGRNYWHRENNDYDGVSFAWDGDTPSEGDDLTNRLDPADPRLVMLFLTPYDSFSGSGQDVFPIVSLGSFYITGYGRINGSGGFQGGGPEDPCGDGSDSPAYPYAGNDPPPDLNTSGASAGGTVVWGHFVKHVTQSADTLGGSGTPCDGSSLQPCVAVLVE